MSLTLFWKEYREHRSVWVSMVIMTALFALGAGQPAFSQHPAATLGITVLAMAAVYGVVCGAMMFAGEKEGGTLVFLDVFLGRRGLLWLGKLLIGVVLVITEALAVAVALTLLKLDPPDWMGTVVGRWSWHVGMPVQAPASAGLWFYAVPMVTLEALAWGLFGSAMTQRVLAGAGLGILMGFFAWMLTIAFPPPASIMIRMIVFGFVLLGSYAIFVNQARDTFLALPMPPLDSPKLAVLRELERERHINYRIAVVTREETAEPEVVVPAILAEPKAKPRTDSRRRRRYREAESPSQVLLWLLFRQGQIVLPCLAAATFLMGFFMPVAGQALWPLVTMLVGIACGTATFAWEQSDLSYQFLAAQRFPLKTVWNAKILFWLTTMVLATLLLCVGAAMVFALTARAFDFGALRGILGSILFFTVWPIYGFCVSQVVVLFCRKTVYAVIISAMVTMAALGLWLPSLLCRGMSGWQVWVPPIAMLLATRVLIRAWAGGRIKDRRPMAGVAGVGAGIFVLAALTFAYRAWEIPDVGEPLDRIAFRAAIPSREDNPAGKNIEEALAEMENPDGKFAVWSGKLADSAKLKPAMLEMPQGDGQAPGLRHLPSCRNMLGRLMQAAAAQRQKELALDYIHQALTLSRSLRNKAPLASYEAGVETEQVALDGLEKWVVTHQPSAVLLKAALTELDRHIAATPPALDCLQTECYRTGGRLDNPVGWSFYSAPGQEQLLAGSIALSLELPWEAERRSRLWRAVWAGHFRALQTPHWQLPQPVVDVSSDDSKTRKIFRGWLPDANGRGVSANATQLARLLDASWLADDRLYTDVVKLRSAATRSQWRVNATRQVLALRLYQLREARPAQKLDDLVPKDLPELPVDPYSGKTFGYRISEGENLEAVQPGGFPGRNPIVVPAGAAILWSTGPDRNDNSGRKDGRWMLADDDPRWSRDGFDLATVVGR